jgi:hypothetical protein
MKSKNLQTLQTQITALKSKKLKNFDNIKTKDIQDKAIKFAISISPSMRRKSVGSPKKQSVKGQNLNVNELWNASNFPHSRSVKSNVSFE